MHLDSPARGECRCYEAKLFRSFDWLRLTGDFHTQRMSIASTNIDITTSTSRSSAIGPEQSSALRLLASDQG